jgi:hypothetical protein
MSAFIALTSSASTSVTERSGSVSHTGSGTGGHGLGALNALTAFNVSCAKARTVAKTFLITRKAPKHWHPSTRMVVENGTTVGEEIVTQGRVCVVGGMAN